LLRISWTYFKNSFVEYSKILISAFFVFVFVIFLFDFLELLRITSKYSLKLPMLVKLALMKNYSSINQTVPMLVLVASLIFFYVKNKNNEIIAAKSIGISAFDIMLPVILATCMFGLINIMVINPVGTMFLQKYQNYEAQKFKNQISLVSVAKSGIWLKNKLEEDNVIINALRVSQSLNTMYDTNVFFINNNGEMRKQITAKSILFQDNEIIINDAFIIDQDFKMSSADKIVLPIKIFISQIFENLTSIETISFFQLLELIQVTQDSGLSTTRYTLWFLKEMLSPLFLISMVIVSYFYCCHITRRKRVDLSPLFCVITGFAIYFLTNFIHALGASGQISIFLSVLFPIITFNTLATYLVVHKN
jgi:lipopolysaccharide export system permease protein